MKHIDMATWPRKKHFEYFRSLDFPHLNVTANMDVTLFHKRVKEQHLSFFKAFLFAAVKTANEIKEFRYRIREEAVVEHEVVNPSFTVMTSEDLFGFCSTPFEDNFPAFLENVTQRMELAKQSIYLEDEEGVDNLLYMTCLPWVSFTSVMHPLHLSPADSIPRIAWGKFFEENGKMKLPVSVQAHHALVDGIHVGRFFIGLQAWLDDSRNYEIGK